MTAPDWRERAKCRGLDPELFFPRKGETAGAAKAVCATCDVRDECYAIAERQGVWGGTSERERRGKRRGQPVEKRCARCRAPFVASRGRTYCGDECAAAVRRERLALGAKSREYPRRCVVCALPFLATAPDRLTCSVRCLREHQRLTAARRFAS